MTPQNRNQIAIKLIMLCALVLSAFAHRAMPVQNNLAEIDMRAYAAQFTLPDGTLPVLCLQGQSNSPQRSVPCDFCLIASNTLLGEPQLDLATTVQMVSLIALLPHKGENTQQQLYRLYAPLRAPPLA